MGRVFKGRAVLPGNIKGECIVTHEGLNILAAFQKSVLKKAKKAICSDQNNKELFGKELSGKIICLPKTIGSTTGGMVIQTISKLGIAPLAFLFSEHIDPLATAGVILSDVWNKKRIVTVDMLGSEFLEYVKDGMAIEIKEDGTVIID